MSVFSLIKRGRQAAKEHNAKQVEKQKKEGESVPYKHVPTHAAVDALSGAPSSWKHDDRPRIIEAHRRRSAMAASSLGMSSMGSFGPGTNPVHMGMPRVNSALSHVSYPSNYANPVVQMPRTYSYSSVQPPQGWSHQGGEVVYSSGNQNGMGWKGKEVERPPMIDSGRASRSSSKRWLTSYQIRGPGMLIYITADSPVGSSSNSTSSQDDLEMKPARHTSQPPTNNAPEVKTPQGEHLHRLHPQSRRISDPPVVNGYFSLPRNVSNSTRPTPSRASSSSMVTPGIPPVPALPPMQFGPLTTPPLSTALHAQTTSTATSATSLTFVQGNSTPSPKASFMMPTPAPVPEEIMLSDPITLPPVGTAITTPPLSHKNRRISKSTRFTELETINSHIDPPKLPINERLRLTVDNTTLPTEFDESSFSLPPTPQEPVVAAMPQKTGKLSKAPGAKLSKKNRWSLRGNKSTAVAV